MSLIARRLIFYCATVTFLATAPLIIGYTAGYRYNIKQNRIVKTGAIFIASQPKDARISINDTTRKEQTPSAILNLTPGEYRVSVSKDGYRTWEKKLIVESERMTFSNMITLVADSPAQLLLATDATSLAPMPRENEIVYRSGGEAMNELWVRRVADHTPQLLYRSAAPIRTIQEVSRGGTIMLTDEVTHTPILVSPEKNATPLDLATISPAPLESVHFDNRDSNIVLALHKGSLVSMNTKTRLVRTIATDIRDYRATKNGYLAITETKKPALISFSYDGSGQSTIVSLDAGYKKIFEPIDTLQPIWNAATDETTLLDLKSPDMASAVRAPGTIVAVTGHNETTSIITATDHEIWQTLIRSGRPELVTRVSDQIQKIVLHPDGGVLLYATKEHVRAIELDYRDNRNMYDLGQFETISDMSLTREGTSLIVAGTHNAVRGLWQIVIR